MAGGVYNLVLGADEINEAVSGAYQALISADGYTGDINIVGNGSFNTLHSEFLNAAKNVNVTGHLIVNDNITGFGSSEFANLIATGNSFLSNVTGNAGFDQITATGATDLASLINGISIAGGADIAGGLNVDGGIRNTGDFKNFGEFHVNNDVFITGDTTITGTLFVNGTAITGENGDVNITITGNGTGGLNFFEEEFQEFTAGRNRGASLIHSTGVGTESSITNPTSIDFSINAKGNGAYVINSPDNAGHRVDLGLKAIDFQPERDAGALVLEKTYATKGITVGSNNVNYSKEGVIIGNKNTLDIGEDEEIDRDVNNYDFIGNFIGGRSNKFTNSHSVNVIGVENTGYSLEDAGGLNNANIIGNFNFISGTAPATSTNTFIGGNHNRITGSAGACAAVGNYNYVLGSNSIVLGRSNTVLKSNSTAIGVNSLASRFGEISLSNGRFSANGDSQTSIFVSRCLTTNDVETEVFLDNSSERITVATDSAIAFESLIVAKEASNSNAAGYKISGIIGNNGGTTALVGSIIKTDLGESVSSWDATIEADDTNDALVIKVTGTSGNNIRWVATTTTSEVVF